MNIKEMFDGFRREAESLVRNNREQTIIYVSGTTTKYNKFMSMIEKYNNDSKLDDELGINPCRDLEEKAYKIMMKSMQFYSKF